MQQTFIYCIRSRRVLRCEGKQPAYQSQYRDLERTYGATDLRTGRRENRGSIPCIQKSFLSFPKHPKRVIRLISEWYLSIFPQTLTHPGVNVSSHLRKRCVSFASVFGTAAATWCSYGCKLCMRLTLRLLMSYIYIYIYIYIYGAPSKARNVNVVYIWTYVWQRWNSLFLFAAQYFNTESMQRGFLCHICV